MKFEKYFLRAIELAESVKGLTSPNPAVGCIIVKEGRIVGEGSTGRAGFDHAEKIAIKVAGSEATGSELFVTMEPCIEFPGKKTASCAKSIINAGIKRVYISMIDPNPEVSGKGISVMKNAGIDVKITRLYRKRITSLNEDYSKFIRSGLPWVYLKCALTLDGNIADKNGNSRWISCEESRRYVHMMRNRVDAILVGVGTILQDNPELNVRLVNKLKDPLRIIIDPSGRTPASSFVMNDDGKTLFITGKDLRSEFKEMCIKKNKEFLEFEMYDDPTAGYKKFSFKELMKFLSSDRGIESVMVEGGAKTYYHALKDGIIDKIILFIAPKILGGTGIPFFKGGNGLSINEALSLKDFSTENIGVDILIEGYL